MPALKHDVIIEQGATFQRQFTVTVPGTGEPFMMAGFTIEAQLHNSATGAVVADFISEIVENTLLIELPESVTATLPPATTFTHRYTASVRSPANIVYRIAQGDALISAE